MASGKRQFREVGSILTENERKSIRREKIEDHSNPSKIAADVRSKYRDLPAIIDRFFTDLYLIHDYYGFQLGWTGEVRQANSEAIMKTVTKYVADGHTFKTLPDNPIFKKLHTEYVLSEDARERASNLAYGEYVSSLAKRLNGSRLKHAKRDLLRIYDYVRRNFWNKNSPFFITSPESKSGLQPVYDQKALEFLEKNRLIHGNIHDGPFYINENGIRVARILLENKDKQRARKEIQKRLKLNQTV